MTAIYFPNSVIKSTINPREVVEDCIILMRNIVAGGHDNTGISTNLVGNGLMVSYMAYQWSLGFHVLITDADQISRMQEAVNFNLTELRSHIPEFTRVNKEINKLSHYGFEKLRQQFKQEHSADQLMQQYLAEKNAGTLPCNLMAGDYEDHVFTPYKDKVMAPYLEQMSVAFYDSIL